MIIIASGGGQRPWWQRQRGGWARWLGAVGRGWGTFDRVTSSLVHCRDTEAQPSVRSPLPPSPPYAQKAACSPFTRSTTRPSGPLPIAAIGEFKMGTPVEVQSHVSVPRCMEAHHFPWKRERPATRHDLYMTFPVHSTHPFGGGGLTRNVARRASKRQRPCNWTCGTPGRQTEGVRIGHHVSDHTDMDKIC